MPARRNRPTILESAVRGAVAGLVGGATTVVAERLVLPRTPAQKRPRRYRFERQVQELADRAGYRLRARQRARISIGLELAIAAALGAAYGVARDHLDLSVDGERLLYSALGYAISPVAPQLPTRKTRRARGLLRQFAVSATEPITPPAIYNTATTLALRALGAR